MRPVNSIVVVLAVTLSAGCASADVMLLDPSRTYAPTTNVKLLLEEPDQAYEIIAIVEARGSQYNNQSQVVRAAQKRAGKLGAHAIIPITTEKTNVAPQTIPNPVAGGEPIYIMGGTQMMMKFAAIRFTKGE